MKILAVTEDGGGAGGEAGQVAWKKIICKWWVNGFLKCKKSWWW